LGTDAKNEADSYLGFVVINLIAVTAYVTGTANGAGIIKGLSFFSGLRINLY